MNREIAKAIAPEPSALHDPVLVLNKNWIPIDAVTVRDAFVDLCGEKAHVVHPETYELLDIDGWFAQAIPEGGRFIRTSQMPVRAPEVIVNNCKMIPNRKVIFSRRNLWKRDGFRCAYCGCKPALDDITIDHVVPRAIWARQHHDKSVTSFDNCVLACIECNKKKDNRTPEQAGMRLRRMVKSSDGILKPVYYARPKAPQWSPIYAIRRVRAIPESWSKFIDNLVSEAYWNTELMGE
jgi:hypothetical protein